MKKLFSTFLSVMTSAALALGASAPAVTSAEGLQETDYVTGMISFDSTDFLANFSEDAHIYGNYLDANNLEVYKAMISLVVPSTDRITVKLPEPVKISVSSTNAQTMSDEDRQLYEDAVMGACRSGVDSALFDMPEIFWLDIANMGVGTQSIPTWNRRTRKYDMTINSIIFEPAYYAEYDSMDTVEEYRQQLLDAIDSFEVKGETRYEQIKSIHDTISKFTYYDVNARFLSSPIGSLVEPGAVCEGYAEGFKLICDRIGIPCVLVVGNFDDANNEAHMWNYVKMEDGKWYAVDVTWDDRDGQYGVDVMYKYLLKGSKTMSADHFPETQFGYTQLTYPELSSEDYDPNKPQVTTTTTTSTTTTTTTTTSKTTTTTTTSTTSTTTTSTTTATTTTSSTTTTTTAPVVTEPTTGEPDPVEGDVNGDGKFDIADLVYCSQTVLGNIQPEHSCDADGDGIVDGYDITYIRILLLDLLNDKKI
ncbi:MAG: hypothetical protein IJK31_04780 [Ruminococcus sp.]|nr:hypothetical protein [Ruminococcus sp.]